MRTRAIPERLGGVITTRRYTNPRLPLPLRMALNVEVRYAHVTMCCTCIWTQIHITHFQLIFGKCFELVQSHAEVYVLKACDACAGMGQL